MLLCCFAEDGTDLFISACRKCSTIIFLHSTNQILNHMALSLPFPSLMLRLLTNYLAGYEECCSSSRLFCSYQPNWFIIRQCLFFFLSLFTTDTNAGQSHRLTNRIQNLHRYNLKSLIFKHSLLFIHTFKNTSQVLRPIAHKCYISSSN